jgi:hypothetical protein
MVSLLQPPDFARLAAAARELENPTVAPPLRCMDRRRTPRRDVGAPVYLGIVPKHCEHLRLSRIPATVFKPVSGAWAINLSVAGLAVLSETPLELRSRHWLRLDHLAIRPTLLPACVEASEPVADHLHLVRLRFLVEDADTAHRLGFLPTATSTGFIAA